MVETVNVLREILDELLLTQSAKRTSNPDQIHIRCRMPDCGDSPNINSAHMYVGVSRKDPSKLGYECKKCSAAGYVNEDFLRLYDIDSSRFIDYFKSVGRSGLRKSYDINKNRKLDVVIPRSIKATDKFKVDYISKRIGREITVDDIDTMKIVLNLRQFLEFNKIDIMSMVTVPNVENVDIVEIEKMKSNLNSTIDELSKNFFGFLSANNNRITMRNMGSLSMTEKYHVFTIDPTIQDPFIYYPKMNIDICTQTPEIVMAEGVFDILNIREHFYDGGVGHENIFFAAVGGAGSYRRCLKSILKMTGFIDGRVTIYSDSDITVDQYRRMFSEFSEYIRFTLVYNTSSKDFGDKSDEWNTRSMKLTW